MQLRQEVIDADIEEAGGREQLLHAQPVSATLDLLDLLEADAEHRHQGGEREPAPLAQIAKRFANSGFDVQQLLAGQVLSAAFCNAGTICGCSGV